MPIQLKNKGNIPLYSGANALINDIAIQSDNKIILAGNFTTWNGITVNRIVRLNSNDTHDTAFTTNTGTASATTELTALAIQSDGKILVGGSFILWNGVSAIRMVRLNSDGTLDTAFNTNIGTGANAGSINTIAVQSDGKILVGGGFTSWNGTTIGRMVRLNSDGTLDTAFTTNTGTAANGQINSIVVQSDNKILVGGGFTTWNGATVGRVVRLNADGTRDTVFSANNGTGASSGINSIAIQSDGKIILAGGFTSWNGITSTSNDNILRLNSDGTHDSVFTTNIGTGADTTTINAVAIDGSGKILVGLALGGWGGSYANYRIIRLNSDGTLDTAFITNTGFNSNNAVNGITLTPDNQILVGGTFTFWNANVRLYLVRISSNGQEVPSAIPYTKVAGTWKSAKSVWNKVSGTWKSSFLQGGIDDLSFFQGQTGPNNFVYVTVVQPDGKLLVGGNFTTWNGTTANGFVRLNADASIDTAFMANVGTGGAGAGPSVQDIILNPDGSIILGGVFLTWNGATSNYIVKLNSNGTRDTTFGTNIGTAANSTVWALERNPDGTIIAAGTFSTWNGTAVGRIVKLSEAGVRDTTFTTNNAGGANGSIRALTVDSGLNIVAGGLFTTWGTTPVTVNYIVKVGPTGGRNNTFTTNVGTTQNNNVYAIAQDKTGGYIIGGDFTIWGGVSVGRIVKINSVGNRDTTFTTNNGTGFDSTVWTAMQIDEAGRIMVGGFFTTFNGVSTPYIARLSATGVREAMFTTNISGINIGVQGITLDNNGKAYIGGRFTTINGRTYNKFARIGAEATA